MIDWKALHSLCEHKAKSQHLSFRKIAKQIGATGSGSCFTRMKQGKPTDADTFVAILAWLGISYRSILKKASGKGTGG